MHSTIAEKSDCGHESLPRPEELEKLLANRLAQLEQKELAASKQPHHARTQEGSPRLPSSLSMLDRLSSR